MRKLLTKPRQKATQHNNPNAPDRREVICEHSRLFAAGDLKRYTALSYRWDVFESLSLRCDRQVGSS